MMVTVNLNRSDFIPAENNLDAFQDYLLEDLLPGFTAEEMEEVDTVEIEVTSFRAFNYDGDQVGGKRQ